MGGERFDSEGLAGLPVEDAVAAPVDYGAVRAAPLLSYLPRVRRRWVVLAGGCAVLGVVSVGLGLLGVAQRSWFSWVLAAVWVGQAIVYGYLGCDEQRRLHPAVAGESGAER